MLKSVFSGHTVEQ